MNHPDRIRFTCDITAPASSVNGGRYAIEFIDLMSMMNKDERLASECGHKYIAHFFHSGAVLFVGIVYFPKYVDNYELRFGCLKGISEQLVAFMRKNIKPSRVVFRMEEVEVIWEAESGSRQVVQPLTPDSLTSIELEVQYVRLPTGAIKNSTTCRHGMR